MRRTYKNSTVKPLWCAAIAFLFAASQAAGDNRATEIAEILRDSPAFAARSPEWIGEMAAGLAESPRISVVGPFTLRLVARSLDPTAVSANAETTAGLVSALAEEAELRLRKGEAPAAIGVSVRNVSRAAADEAADEAAGEQGGPPAALPAEHTTQRIGSSAAAARGLRRRPESLPAATGRSDDRGPGVGPVGPSPVGPGAAGPGAAGDRPPGDGSQRP